MTEARIIRVRPGDLIWHRRDMLGRPCEVWVMPREWVTPLAPTDTMPQGAFRIVDGTGRAFEVDARETMGGAALWHFEVVKGTPPKGGWDNPPTTPDEPDAPTIVDGSTK